MDFGEISPKSGGWSPARPPILSTFSSFSLQKTSLKVPNGHKTGGKVSRYRSSFRSCENYDRSTLETQNSKGNEQIRCILVKSAPKNGVEIPVKTPYFDIIIFFDRL